MEFAVNGLSDPSLIAEPMSPPDPIVQIKVSVVKGVLGITDDNVEGLAQ